MKNAEQIKKEASEFHSKEQYKEAYTCLLQLGAYEFIKYFSHQDRIGKPKKNRLRAGESSRVFWSDFVLEDEHFRKLLQAKNTSQLFHIYFEYNIVSYPDFLNKVAEHYPELLIEQVRRNMAFLKENHQGSLLALQFPQHLQIHLEIWQQLAGIESKHWQEIQQQFEKVIELDLTEVLLDCVIYLESRRFEVGNNPSIIQNMAFAYNFFISYLFSDSKFTNQKLQFNEGVIKLLINKINHYRTEKQVYEEQPISRLLSHIEQWVDRYYNLIELYCYDTEIEPFYLGNIIQLRSDPKKHYQFKVDGARYEEVRLLYKLEGINFLEYLIEHENFVVPGKTEFDQNINQNIQVNNFSIQFVLDNLGIDEYKYQGQSYFTMNIVAPLTTQSLHKNVRYEDQILACKDQHNNWIDAFFDFVIKGNNSTQYESYPFLFHTLQVQQEMNEKVFQDAVPTVEVLLSIYGYKVKEASNFDRFNLAYDVYENPFIVKDNHIFTPALFFASADWFIPLIKKFSSNNRLGTELMEERLGERFEKKTWNVKIISNEESKNLKGDVDLFVEDAYSTLYIQLKRTRFRLNAKESYNELQNIDGHAAEQLNEAEQFLSKKNDIFNPKHKPYKWIVSTSCEKINTEIKGCRKINFFELFLALNNTELKSLADLITFMEQDQLIKNIHKELLNSKEIADHPFYQGIKERLKIFQQKQYSRSIMMKNHEDATYIRLYNKALEMQESGKIDKAIRYLEKAIAMEPSDPELYGALANIYADQKLYTKSYKTFEKALGLAPDDPYILRNYAIGLIEAGCWYEGLKAAKRLYSLYPLLEDNYLIFNKNYELAIKQGILTEEQVLEFDNISKSQS